MLLAFMCRKPVSSILPRFQFVRALTRSSYIKDKYNGFASKSIQHLLSFLRWTNLLTSFVVCFFGAITSINYALSLNVSTFLLTAYCFLFSGILFLFELHTKRIGDRFRAEYGFLFTYIGRCLYIFL